MKNILIVGANSAIASACGRLLATDSTTFFLVGRTLDKLNQVADDLTARGATVHSRVLDLNQFAEHTAMLDACYVALGHVDIALIAHGTLPGIEAILKSKA